jgi:hypothetical protein
VSLAGKKTLRLSFEVLSVANALVDERIQAAKRRTTMTNHIEKELDLQIEELETIVAPGVATSPGPLLGGLVNHNETMSLKH